MRDRQTYTVYTRSEKSGSLTPVTNYFRHLDAMRALKHIVALAQQPDTTSVVKVVGIMDRNRPPSEWYEEDVPS